MEERFKSQHSLLETILAWSGGKTSPELETFASGPYAAAGACLASGWAEAALKLAPTDRALAGTPEWFVYGLAQALRQNRGNTAALTFIKLQPRTPLVQLLTGELLLASGDRKSAAAELEPLAGLGTDVGYRAAWLLASDAADQKNTAAARRFVTGQAALASSTTGRELLARLALAEGDEQGAARQYEAIAAESAEAKAWLARKAYKEKRWDEARRLTSDLIKQFPDEMTLRENMEAINRASSK